MQTDFLILKSLNINNINKNINVSFFTLEDKENNSIYNNSINNKFKNKNDKIKIRRAIYKIIY